jgi:hypothetical protein
MFLLLKLVVAGATRPALLGGTRTLRDDAQARAERHLGRDNRALVSA